VHKVTNSKGIVAFAFGAVGLSHRRLTRFDLFDRRKDVPIAWEAAVPWGG